MSKKQKDEYIDDFIEDFEEVEISSKPKFVANSIIYVEGEESDESSDESYDSSDKEQFDELDTQDLHSLPYRTFRITKSKAKKGKGEYKFSKPVGYVEEEELPTIDKDYSMRKSVVVQPFLDNLYNTGFEDGSKEPIEDTVSVSVALNRPLSLSSRKNNLLHKELQSKIDSTIEHSQFGIFWKFNWYNSKNKSVQYDVVKSFYKKLKRYDSEHGTSKAEDFRKLCESGIAVPYQELREAAKNHDNTKKLVVDARLASPDSDIYLSVVDGDTISFNGIYSAYLRIHDKAEIAPTIMSTGYEFTEEKEGDRPIVEGSKLCREIRVATAKFVKLGVYITEPNFCVMVSQNDETVSESFIDKSIKAGGVTIKNAESVALMRNIIASRGLDSIIVVVSGDNSLLTAIPHRVRYIKSNKSIEIKFSAGFKAGLGPTEKDLVSFKQMSQSHVHEGVWIDNLSINRAITLKKGFHFKFKGLLTKYLKSEITTAEQEQLLTIISAEDLARVKSAYDAKEKIIQLYKDENLRKADQQALIDYISKHEELEIDDFEAEFLEIIANAEIISLLEDEILDLGEMSEVSSDILRELLYDDEVISLLKEEKMSFDEVYLIYYEYIEDSDEGVGDFSFIKLCKLLTSNESGFKNLLFELEMNISDIIKLYDEDEEVFSELSKDKTIAFLKEYGSDIEFDHLVEIYHDNPGLFYALVDDPNDVIQNIGVKDFIDKFEDAQARISEIPMDDPYHGAYDLYDSVRSDMIDDGCPDEFLMGSSDEWYDDYY